MGHIAQIEIDDANLPPPTPEIEQERRVALFDILEGNRFELPGDPRGVASDASYGVRLSVREKRLVFEVRDAQGDPAARFHLSLSPFRQVIKDYFQICASYYDAVRTLPPGQIEAIDAARRAIHDEGGRILQERLTGKADLDAATARRLFTLICVLRFGG